MNVIVPTFEDTMRYGRGYNRTVSGAEHDPSLCGSITRGLGYRNLAGRMAAMGGGVKPYTAVEYLENDLASDCYIDLGIYADGNTKVSIVMMGIDEFGAYYFGARLTWAQRAFAISTGDVAGRGTQVNYGNFALGSHSITYVNTYNTKTTVVLGNGVFHSHNDTQTYDYPFSPVIFTTDRTLYVFGVNGIYPASVERVRIYDIEIYDSNTRIMKLIPVKKDGKGCLYDVDNPTGGPYGDGFYRTSGTGSLIVGPEI